MSAITLTISAANVAAELNAMSTIQTLINNGNPNLLTLGQTEAMSRVQSLFAGHSAGFNSYSFNNAQLQDMLTVTQSLYGLANNGLVFTYTQNQAAAGNVIPIVSNVANPYPVGANTGVFINGKVIVEQPGTQNFYSSDINDATIWPPLNFGTAESNPDNLLAVNRLNGQLVAFGSQSLQYFADVGASPGSPFVEVESSAQDFGLESIYSIQQFMGSLAFLGRNVNGITQVMKIQNYTPVPISTTDIDHWINLFQYRTYAMGATYIVDGHPMYAITFPVEGVTFEYDGLTQIWGVRQSGVGHNGRWNTQFAVTYNSGNYISDSSSGDIYFLDITNPTENEAPMKKRWVTKHLKQDGKAFGISQLYADVQVGQGAYVGGLPIEPIIIMRYSKDGGYTWSTPAPMPLGKGGVYLPRVNWKRLGIGRDFVFEFWTTDNVALTVTGVYATFQQGTEE